MDYFETLCCANAKEQLYTLIRSVERLGTDPMLTELQQQLSNAEKVLAAYVDQQMRKGRGGGD